MSGLYFKDRHGADIIKWEAATNYWMSEAKVWRERSDYYQEKVDAT